MCSKRNPIKTWGWGMCGNHCHSLPHPDLARSPSGSHLDQTPIVRRTLRPNVLDNDIFAQLKAGDSTPKQNKKLDPSSIRKTCGGGNCLTHLINQNSIQKINAPNAKPQKARRTDTQPGFAQHIFFAHVLEASTLARLPSGVFRGQIHFDLYIHIYIFVCMHACMYVYIW